MNKFSNCISKIHQSFLDYIFTRQINYIKIKKNYKIIPLGTFCYSRVITTYNGLKPTKAQGELSCPFDMAFFYKPDTIASLIETKFESFFDDVFFDEDKKYYINDTIGGIFNHDGKLSKTEFEERYRKRIDNFYNYLSDKNIHKYFLLASRREIKDSVLDAMFAAISNFCEKDDFDIILINQSPQKRKLYKNKIYAKNFYLINDYKNYKTFQEINSNGNWIGELKAQNTAAARKIYNDNTLALIKILSK